MYNTDVPNLRPLSLNSRYAPPNPSRPCGQRASEDEKALTQVPLMFCSMLLFHTIAILCMSLRLYSKRVSKTRYFIDDYVLILSLVSVFLLCLLNRSFARNFC